MNRSAAGGLQTVAAPADFDWCDRPPKHMRVLRRERLTTITPNRPGVAAVPRQKPRPVTGPSGLGYTGNDISLFQDAVAESLAPFRIRPVSPGPFRGRVAVARSSDVVVATICCDVTVQASIESLPENAYFVTLTGDGVAALVDSVPVEHGSNVAGPGRQVRIRWAASRPVTVIKLSRRLLERVWRDQGGRSASGPLNFAVPLNPVAVRSGIWEALADAFVAACESGLLDSAAVNAHFGQLLAQSLLSMQPQTRPQPVPDPVGHAPHADQAPHGAGTAEANDVLPVPAPVLRALEFCRTHAREPLTVADIADAAGISVRRLQATFRTHVGTTPIEYVKRLRLAGVHADLRSIAQGNTHETVTDVALRWGFTHLGRFSGTYRAEFGQLPSQTAGRNPSGRK
ncbi:AraC family transcriptional regulator [Yinghuangia sp. YIM S10712]|uniref:AraC family transcriptional regulator n=1 Tax=Yinghuangia sp. YIM S10712 TaxID=3436930 RepID=UPI003F52DCF7